ncbi:hypothetical protein RND71_009562 [Anisodus tanguticus]|uniref:Pentatricopeptide repeat-containing protein n=1 Tax=Anisodus tanguticus TaxID=243964 RepID=A0AAE1VIA7_9SOLA|nr:hypothetical protein RND71_009562 [Anisodus tanguticus]
MRRAYSLKPRAESYCCLVDILGCGKLVEEAIRVVNQMPPEECDGTMDKMNPDLKGEIEKKLNIYYWEELTA